ncbi:MAG: efflux RND transporter periplasmic adaptor subunit [Pseudomonadota bacterium]
MMDQKKPKSLVRKLATGVATLTITAGVIVLSGAAVWQGSTLIASRAAAVEKPAPTEIIGVSVAQIVPSNGYTVDRKFAGQIEAPQSADVSFEQGGTLNEVFVDEGDAVSEGEVLARLDDRLLTADLDRLNASKRALEAQIELARLTNERQAALKKKGFATGQVADQSRLSLVELEAKLAELDASILAAEIRLEKTEIKAPFDGVVNARLFDPGSIVGATQAVLTLVNDGLPVFRVGVAPGLVDQLNIGSTIDVALDGEQHAAEIIAILPQIDPVTRTRIVRARLVAGVDLAFGMTGEAVVRETIAENGSWVPLTAIEDGVRGLWTIKTIKQGEPTTVALEAVEIIHADSQRAFVRGTFSSDTKYIDTGVHRIVGGQVVRIEQ